MRFEGAETTKNHLAAGRRDLGGLLPWIGLVKDQKGSVW